VTTCSYRCPAKAAGGRVGSEAGWEPVKAWPVMGRMKVEKLDDRAIAAFHGSLPVGRAEGDKRLSAAVPPPDGCVVGHLEMVADGVRLVVIGHLCGREREEVGRVSAVTPVRRAWWGSVTVNDGQRNGVSVKRGYMHIMNTYETKNGTHVNRHTLSVLWEVLCEIVGLTHGKRVA
jgi:hypothetical protein